MLGCFQYVAYLETPRTRMSPSDTHQRAHASPPSLFRNPRGSPAPLTAEMIILCLTIFANIFKTGWTGTNERTFIAVKPDGVQRRLVGEIILRFERKGFKLVGMKLLQASEEQLRQHYRDLREKPFYGGLVKYMSSGPIVAMVWQGLDVVKTARKMLGETNPADSLPGTIRGDYCIEVGRNVIHGSDSVESAQREISLWFEHHELFCWEECNEHWIYA
uniref:Nucleoside diphosphate kinase n=1 Tax=Cyprinus carpio TaxID=7962 RepID=A0A8C2DDU1_CYPCA